ncbi:unnamed protein product [Didymodactylos carnosus]|uniref:Uncharacterized protein n=1 Tax=Didymodactylos carnosus TaxID=1234261 RepID=A0A814GU15_9BILA|nr:unnamed protein product [Didymodactylos carnosus]CAF3772693.1 unnamed protein product [Didymodactylos carnosus]
MQMSCSSSSDHLLLLPSSHRNSYKYFPHYFKRRRTRQYKIAFHFTIPFFTIFSTLFFIILNIHVVLSLTNDPLLSTAKTDRNDGVHKSMINSKNDTSTTTSNRTKTKRLTHEKRLIRDLLDNYPTIYARPILNVSDAVKIQFELTLAQLLDLGSNTQTLQTNTWKTYMWNDINLVWNETEYGGLQTVRIPADLIWTPDVVLYNYADERLKERRDIQAVIQHTGDVLYVPATISFSVCFLDITNFPYDTHECSLGFRSWTYDQSKIILDFKEYVEAIDMSTYIISNEWRVVPKIATKSPLNETYSMLTFTLMIQRKGGLYGYILILPCLLLSAATMVVFWLPPESPSKMILTISIFSGLFLLLLLLAESIPGGGGTPKIGYYYCMNMIVVAVTAVCATTVIHIFVRGDRRQGVPPTIRKIFLHYLARLYCMQPKVPSQSKSSTLSPLLLPEQLLLTSHYHEEEFSKKLNLLKQRFQEYQKHKSFNSHQYQNNNQQSVSEHQIMTQLSLNLTNIENDLKEIRDYLRHMKKKIEDTERSNKIANDWKLVALVLDRTFFFAYCFWLALSMIVMFPKANQLPTDLASPAPPAIAPAGLGNATGTNLTHILNSTNDYSVFS